MRPSLVVTGLPVSVPSIRLRPAEGSALPRSAVHHRHQRLFPLLGAAQGNQGRPAGTFLHWPLNWPLVEWKRWELGLQSRAVNGRWEGGHSQTCSQSKGGQPKLLRSGLSASLTSCVPPQVVIPVSSIHIVKKQNTALLVPNALSIRTTDGFKVSCKRLSRDSAHPASPDIS